MFIFLRYNFKERLTKEGRQKLRKAITELGASWVKVGSCLRADDFKEIEDWLTFKDDLAVYMVMSEFVNEDEDKDYEYGWELTYEEGATYYGLAKIIVDLRQRLAEVEEKAADAVMRLDNIKSI